MDAGAIEATILFTLPAITIGSVKKLVLPFLLCPDGVVRRKRSAKVQYSINNVHHGQRP